MPLTPSPMRLLRKHTTRCLLLTLFYLSASLFLPAFSPAGFTLPTVFATPSSSVVISQVYGGGGNSGASYKNDFIELFNRGSRPVDLSGWTVQYAGATSSNFASSTPLSGIIAPGQYWLVGEGAGAGGTLDLPAPDVIGAIPLGASSGKVALVAGSALLSCSGTSNPTCNPAYLDLVSYGSSATPYEGSGPTPGLNNTTAAFRLNGGCTDTDNNSADFSTGNPNPRNSATTKAPCGPVTNQAVVASCGSSTFNTSQGTPASRTVTATDPDGIVTGASVASLSPSPAPGSIGLTAVTPASSMGGTLAATLTVSKDVPQGVYSVTLNFSNNDTPVPQTAGCTLTVNVAAPVAITHIYTIQGAALASPLEGQTVTTEGVVTGLKSNGFFLQDATGDGNPATSDGIFIFTGSTPAITNGHSARVQGTVTEFRTASRPEDATLTELNNVTVTDLGSGSAITPVVISTAGSGPGVRNPPLASIYSTPAYDPAIDGLDFYESLEGMLVQVNNGLVVGQKTTYSDFPIVPDNGVGVSGLTGRGALAISANDQNPERIFVGDDALGIGTNPNVSVGDTLTAPVTGPLDYSYGNFKIQEAVLPGYSSANRPAPVILPSLSNPEHVRVASYNIENFSSADATHLAQVANHIRVNLAAPDILVLCEVQDDSGPANDGVTTAVQNLGALRDAVQAGGGPLYSFRFISPLNNQDGGQPGGNIRVAFFFRTDRGLSFVDRGSAGSTDANSVLADGSLTLSPGRIDPTNTAFYDSRKPLAGEFTFQGQRLIVIANHFNSKIGDEPLYGWHQPPTLTSEAKRVRQATVVRDFITQLISANPQAFVIAAGDFNDFEFSAPLKLLKNGPDNAPLPSGKVLTDLIEHPTLADQRYTYNFEGNAQAIDHLLYSPALAPRLVKAYIAHINADYPVSERASDHDAPAADFDLTPVVDLGLTKSHFGNFTVGTNAGYTLTISNIGSLPASGTITVNDSLPGGLSFQSYSGSGWSCTATGQTVSCANPGPLAVGASSKLVLTVSVNAAVGNIINNASLSFSGDTNLANNTASDPTLVNLTCDRLMVTATTDDGSGTICSTFSYAIQHAGSGETVHFDPAVKQVFLSNPVALIPNSLMIDGSCDKSSGRGKPGVIITANGPVTSALALGNNVTVQGLAFTGFRSYALNINGGGNTLACNWFGTANGTDGAPDGGGIRISGTGSPNILGNPNDPAGGNLFAANFGTGLLVETGSAQLYANWFGLTADGKTLLRNTGGAIRVKAGAHVTMGKGNILRN
ncbi:MAG TPA: lamin tail domain-containing protein [Chloroflexia bacterium]|nr:lamin tail domain-containing protein [Chloroflexia bacterium]